MSDCGWDRQRQMFSGGKTVVLNTLAEAQTLMGLKTTLYTLNPKAISVTELYGILDPLTRTQRSLRKNQ